MGKQSSLVTIFCIWNAMMGTSLLSMPWAFHRAGLAMGIVLVILIGCASFYTCYLIIRVHRAYEGKEQLEDFPDLCKFVLGKWGYIASIITSILTLLGIIVVYWILMSSFLHQTVEFVHGQVGDHWNSSTLNNNSAYCPDSCENKTGLQDTDVGEETSLFTKYWDAQTTVPLYLVVLLAPLVCIKSPTFFTKFSALGFLSNTYIVGFVISRATKWGFYFDFEFSDHSSFYHTFLIGPNVPVLSGILLMALMVQCVIIPILKNNRYQENNVRDLAVGYALTATTYMAVGTVFYLAFPLPKDCIVDDLLNNFFATDITATVARAGLLFQMLTLYPLVAYTLRSQILHAIFKMPYPGFLHVAVVNFVLLAVCVLFALYFPHIGNIVRFSGSLCGLLFVFVLPVLLDAAMQKERNGNVPLFPVFIHACLLLTGVSNFVAQFFI